MDGTSALFERDMVAQQADGIALHERVAKNGAIELLTGEARGETEPFPILRVIKPWSRPLTLFSYTFGEF